MRRFLLVLPFLCAAVPDRAPDPIALTPQEQDTVHQRQVATRFDPGSATGAGVVGVIDVAAPIDATWKALLDVEARVGEVGGLVSVARYLDQPTQIRARWELRVLGSSIVFHLVYDLDPATHFVRFHLDPDRPNDLVSVQGAYQLYPADGHTRLIYWSETDSGRSIPQWLKRWLASDSLGEVLTGIRGRAEGIAERR